MKPLRHPNKLLVDFLSNINLLAEAMKILLKL